MVAFFNAPPGPGYVNCYVNTLNKKATEQYSVALAFFMPADYFMSSPATR